MACTDTGRFSSFAEVFAGRSDSGHRLDILEELIDATYSKDRDAPLSRANLGIEKLRFLFRLSRDLGYLDIRRHEFIMRLLEEIGRRIGAWKKTNRSHENA